MSTTDLLAPYRSQKKQIARYLINHADTTITMDRLADAISIEPSGAWITTRALLKEPALPGLTLVSGNGTAAKVRWSDPTPAYLPTPATSPSETNGSTPVPAPAPAASIMFDLLREIIAESKMTNELLLEIATKPTGPNVEVHNAAPADLKGMLAQINPSKPNLSEWAATHAAATPFVPTAPVEDSDLPATAGTPFTPLSPTSPNESITVNRGRHCTACIHPRRRLIEAYIHEGVESMVRIGEIFELGEHVLRNHRNKHMITTTKETTAP